jgi:hypothetical protein
VFPSITTLELWTRLGLAFLASLFVPLLLALIHCFKAFSVALMRIHHYDILYRHLEKLEEERDVLRSSIIAVLGHLTSGQKLNIKKVICQQNKLQLLLQKKTKKVEVGTPLLAIDVNDGLIRSSGAIFHAIFSVITT